MNLRESNFRTSLTIWGFTVFCSLFSVPTLGAREYSPACIHENMRQTPYPQEYHRPYLNPAPLLVPQQMKQADFLQLRYPKRKTSPKYRQSFPNLSLAVCSILIRY